VDLGDLKLSAGAPIQKLTVSDGTIYAGNAADRFKKATAFKFLQAEAK
jgi:hypothetical protein